MVLDCFTVLGFFNSPILSVLVEAIEPLVYLYGILALHVEKVIPLQGLAFVAVCLPPLQDFLEPPYDQARMMVVLHGSQMGSFLRPMSPSRDQCCA